MKTQRYGVRIIHNINIYGCYVHPDYRDYDKYMTIDQIEEFLEKGKNDITCTEVSVDGYDQVIDMNISHNTEFNHNGDVYRITYILHTKEQQRAVSLENEKKHNEDTRRYWEEQMDKNEKRERKRQAKITKWEEDNDHLWCDLDEDSHYIKTNPHRRKTVWTQIAEDIQKDINKQRS